MTLGRRWLEGAVSRVTEKVTAWTEDERREMAEQKERDNYDAYERDEHGNKLRVTVGRCEIHSGRQVWGGTSWQPCKHCVAASKEPDGKCRCGLPSCLPTPQDDPPDSNDDMLEQLRKVTTGGST